MDRPQVVSRAGCVVARKALLEKKKAATRERDAWSTERRSLPMMLVEKEHIFAGPNGRQTVRDRRGSATTTCILRSVCELGPMLTLADSHAVFASYL